MAKDMKRYAAFFGDDLRVTNYILYEETGIGSKTRLKEVYSQEACPKCGKIDEFGALHKYGIHATVRAPSGVDIFGTDDGYCILSEKAKKFLESEGIGGLEYLPIPESSFYLAEPTIVVAPIRPKQRGFTWGRTCSECGRVKSMHGNITNSVLQSLDIPDLTLFLIDSEGGYGKSCSILYCSEDTGEIIKKQKLRNAWISKLDDKPWVPKD